MVLVANPFGMARIKQSMQVMVLKMKFLHIFTIYVVLLQWLILEQIPMVVNFISIKIRLTAQVNCLAKDTLLKSLMPTKKEEILP